MKIIITIITLVLVLGGCSESYQASAEKRATLASRGKGDIVIGVVWPLNQDLFLKGVKLAVDEINMNNGINGRKIRIISQIERTAIDERDTRRIARQLTHQFVTRHEVVAVIGHANSAIAVPASVTYNAYGILHLSVGATNLMLTEQEFKYIFRMIPNNGVMTEQLVGYCLHKNYNQIVVLNERTDYGEEVASKFYSSAVKFGIKTVYQRSYFQNTEDFRDMIAEFKGKSFDAIFIAGNYVAGARLIKQIQEMGIQTHYLGSDAMDSNKIANLSKGAADGIVVPKAYNPQCSLAEVFAEKFRKKYYGIPPDSWAAQGYDTIGLLAHIMKQTKSTVPMVVGTTLRYMPPWQGITGLHRFNGNGEMLCKRYYFYQLRDGEFEYLPDIFDRTLQYDKRCFE